MTPAADKITSSCNSIKPVMNTKKAPVKKEEVPVFLKKVSAVICYQHLLLSRSRASDITAADCGRTRSAANQRQLDELFLSVLDMRAWRSCLTMALEGGGSGCGDGRANLHVYSTNSYVDFHTIFLTLPPSSPCSPSSSLSPQTFHMINTCDPDIASW